MKRPVEMVLVKDIDLFSFPCEHHILPILGGGSCGVYS